MAHRHTDEDDTLRSIAKSRARPAGRVVWTEHFKTNGVGFDNTLCFQDLKSRSWGLPLFDGEMESGYLAPGCPGPVHAQPGELWMSHGLFLDAQDERATQMEKISTEESGGYDRIIAALPAEDRDIDHFGGGLGYIALGALESDAFTMWAHRTSWYTLGVVTLPEAGLPEIWRGRVVALLGSDAEEAVWVLI